MKVELIIPKNDNDGSDNASVIESSIASLCGLYGGVTAYDATGYWMGAEKLYRDQVTVLVSAATKDATADAVREIAQMVLDVTDQEAVYFAVGDQAEILE